MFQSAVFLLFITMDKVDGGTAPIIPPPPSLGCSMSPVQQTPRSCSPP
jgi:hypothetical protein